MAFISYLWLHVVMEEEKEQNQTFRIQFYWLWEKPAKL